jgi:TOBE domain
VTLASGQSLRVQTHPQQRFAVGDTVMVEVDAGQCTAFRRDPAPVAANSQELQR